MKQASHLSSIMPNSEEGLQEKLFLLLFFLTYQFAPGASTSLAE